MAYTLKQDGTGNYVLDTQDQVKPVTPKVTTTPGEFEAYEGAKDRTELLGGTTLGEQTQKVLREAPGQYQLEFDPETGTFKTKGVTEAVEVEEKPITTLETATSQATKMGETPIEKASRIAAMTRPQSTAPQIDMSQFQGMFAPQQLSTKDKLINTALSVGADVGTKYILKQMGIGTATSTTPIYTGGGINPYQTGGFGGGAGGAGAAAGLMTFAQTGDVKQAVKVGGATAAGTAIGTAVGGPIGGAIGGAIGGMFGCFLPETLVTMADGTKKKIVDIDLKDNIKVGGYVTATGKFLVINLYDYKGIKVSGSHMVKEDDKWLRVKDSKLAKSLGNDEHVVYTLGTQNRRILINDILFTDYFEVDEQMELVSEGDKYFDTWRLHSNQIQDRNVDIMNAS